MRNRKRKTRNCRIRDFEAQRTGPVKTLVHYGIVIRNLIY
jgi:hypothetical protein